MCDDVFFDVQPVNLLQQQLFGIINNLFSFEISVKKRKTKSSATLKTAFKEFLRKFIFVVVREQ